MTIEHFAGPDEPCGCGRPVQYETPSGYACNKHMRCRLVEEGYPADQDDEPIVGIDCCPHQVPYGSDCDACYDEESDSFSIVRAMEKI